MCEALPPRRLTLREARLLLLNAAKDVCIGSGKYSGAQVVQEEKKKPVLRIRTKDNQLVEVCTGLESVSGELCYEYGGPGEDDDEIVQHIDGQMQDAYTQAFGQKVPKFPPKA